MARRCLEGAPRDDSRQALAAFGVPADQLARFDDPIDTTATTPLDVWPEHVTPLLIYRAMLTQWRIGPNGPIGLDYTARAVAVDHLRIKPRAMREAWPDVVAMEHAALEWFARQRE